MATDLTFKDFQALIYERYFETDNARGAGNTFLWLAEEFGELAEAIGRHERGDGDPANLAEEFADLLAWIATMANITDVDLAAAIHDKYVKDGGPSGVK